MTPRITAAMCARGRPLAEPRLSPDGRRVAFADRVGGLDRLVVVDVEGGPEVVVTADLPPAGGGGVFDWVAAGDRLVYATASGQIALVGALGGPATVVFEGPGAGSVAASPVADAVAFVVDERAVTVAALDGSPPCTLSAAADFAVDPAWSPDGARLAWHEWDAPAMPWDESRIRVAPVDGSGLPVVAAGGPGVSVQQPRFSPDGRRLAFLSDASGWCNLWLAAPDGRDARALVAEEHEHGGPTWGGGERTFAWSPAGGAIVFARNEAGFGRLCVVDVGTGRVRELGRGEHRALSWSAERIAAVRTGARTPTVVVAVEPAGGARRVLARGPVGGFESAGLVEPEVVHWTAEDGAPVHGRLYRPPAHVRGGDDPPLLAWLHGGPTGQHTASFDAGVAYFVDRGWAVLVPDPRGSTGWGRAHAQALRGGWGRTDVDDVAAGLRLVGERGWGDPTRVVPVGSSSGGMAALLLVADHGGLCAAAVAQSPVSDLSGLAAGTHRFEAHYPTSLLGPLPAAADVYRRRSPLAAAPRIARPVLLLHGTADQVVPAAHSVDLADRLRQAGATVEHHQYDGEGHGWRRPETAEDALVRMEDFLTRHLRVPMAG